MNNSGVKKKRVGKFVIFMDQTLGSGAYSTVYKGIQQSTQVQVAIKVLDKKMIQQDDYTKNAFSTEIQIMKYLNSPNIIRFYDLHETKNNYYIIQQLASDGTLRNLMNQAPNRRFPQQKALFYFLQLLNGFGELVKNGIIHRYLLAYFRDIKPQNILIKDKILKIADFGFAKQSDNNSFMKTILGTPLYMSPQILKQEAYTYKCDIWALGVMLYEMIIGQPPWPLKHKNMLENIENHQIVFSQQIHIHEKVKQFILGCLKYKEEDRYDWEQIYLHPLFAQKFKQNFINNQHSIKLAFIISQIRMAIHSQNLQIMKIIQKLPVNLGQQDFQLLFKLIDPTLTKPQISLVFKNCKNSYKAHQKVSRQCFLQYLKTLGIRIKSINLISTLGQGQNQVFTLIAKLKQKIDEQDLDLYQIYRTQDKTKTNALELKQFSLLLLKIDENLKQNQIEALFQEFDLNKDKTISYNQFYRTICKIAGVIKQNLHEAKKF